MNMQTLARQDNARSEFIVESAIKKYRKYKRRTKKDKEKNERRDRFSAAQKNKETTFHLLCKLLEERVVQHRNISLEVVRKMWESTYHQGKKLMTIVRSALSWFNKYRQDRYGAYAFYQKKDSLIRFKTN